MTDTLKVRRIGGSLGIILPRAVLETLAVAEGDNLFVTVTPEGLTATAHDPSFDEALDAARAFMKSHHEAFRALAR